MTKYRGTCPKCGTKLEATPKVKRWPAAFDRAFAFFERGFREAERGFRSIHRG